jgi:hypothetical protein
MSLGFKSCLKLVLFCMFKYRLVWGRSSLKTDVVLVMCYMISRLSCNAKTCIKKLDAVGWLVWFQYIWNQGRCPVSLKKQCKDEN